MHYCPVCQAGFEQKMASGTYSLEIDSPFYEIEKRSVQIARAERKKITIPFRRVEGELKVNFCLNFSLF